MGRKTVSDKSYRQRDNLTLTTGGGGVSSSCDVAAPKPYTDILELIASASLRSCCGCHEGWFKRRGDHAWINAGLKGHVPEQVFDYIPTWHDTQPAFPASSKHHTFTRLDHSTSKPQMKSGTRTISTKPTKKFKAEPANISTATRFCFRVRVEDVPGPPLGRSITLANDLLKRNFGRSFNWDSDYVYTPVNIGGEGKAWILLDADKNVEPKPDLKDVELVTFRVRVIKDSL